MARALFDLLPQALSNAYALDIGSATGSVAGELCARYPSMNVVALDLSTKMIERAKEKLLNEGRERPLHLSFVAADFEELPFPQNSFDLVMSNLSYQWASNLRRAFDELFNVLSPGGLVLMNTLTDGTLVELKESFESAEEKFNKNYSRKRPFMPFAAPAAIKALLEGSGLEISYFDERSSIREYTDMWELLRVLKNIGAINPLPIDSASLGAGSLLKSAAGIYKESFSLKTGKGDAGGSVRATYNTVFIMARKPE